MIKLGVNDMRARGYSVREQILNIHTNYPNLAKGTHKTQRCYFIREALVFIYLYKVSSLFEAIKIKLILL